MNKKTTKKPAAKKAEAKKPVKKTTAKKVAATVTEKVQAVKLSKSEILTFDIIEMAEMCGEYADMLASLAKDAGAMCDKDGKPLSKDEIKKEVACLRESAKNVRKVSKKYLGFTADKLLKICK